jgi:hypothetical protein
MKLVHLLLACASLPSTAALAANADAIWFGGDIVTVNPGAPKAEAVAVKDGKTIYTAS